MFPERSIFMQDTNEVIEIPPEEKDDEVLRSAESIPKREKAGAGIDRLLMSFDGRTYNLGNFL